MYTPSPEINLELTNFRCITQHTDFIELTSLQNQEFKGKADNLYILLQSSFVESGKASAVKRSFTSYHHFDEIFNDGKFIIYKGY